MRAPLDTYAFLWFINDSPQLTSGARKVLAPPETEVFLRLASIWEMAIKISLGKLRLNCNTENQPSLERFLPQHLQVNAIKVLNLRFRHVTKVATLPWHHRDPFDRLLASQCLIEQLALVSADQAFDAYGIERLW
jgi:PIN domain nuclease of toxin-antitoxin system